MYDVIGFGVNAIDQVIQLYRIPTADAKVVCPPGKYELYPGGVMGNTLTGLARLGLKTGFMGRIGDDRFGEMLQKYSREDGIDLTACEVVQGADSPWTWIVVDKAGERTITLFPNVLNTIDEEYVHSKMEYIASAQLLHLEGSEMSLKPSLQAAKIARMNGVKVCFDLDIPASDMIDELGLCTREELDEMIGLSDYFIPCIGGAEQLSNAEDPLKMADILRRTYGNEVVALSHGSEGCFVATPSERFQSPAFRITPVDGTGSGDAFHAGMIFGLVKQWPMSKTAEFANACGALNTVVMGARSGMGSAETVEKFIRDHK
jgi:sugar/nucleoside kinase (ribokinase family)